MWGGWHGWVDVTSALKKNKDLEMKASTLAYKNVPGHQSTYVLNWLYSAGKSQIRKKQFFLQI